MLFQDYKSIISAFAVIFPMLFIAWTTTDEIKSLIHKLPTIDDKSAFLYQRANSVNEIFSDLAATLLNGEYNDDLIDGIYSFKFWAEGSENEEIHQVSNIFMELTNKEHFNQLTEQEKVALAKMAAAFRRN